MTESFAWEVSQSIPRGAEFRGEGRAARDKQNKKEGGTL